MTAATPSEQDSGIRNYPGSKLTGPQNNGPRSMEKKYSSKSSFRRFFSRRSASRNAHAPKKCLQLSESISSI
ncbi:hypothetical protein CDAR_190421 [Caerostris darwini]|uniref:Uncharacterized protein n=1 Tax=Caerostris darwini TaxID=1538125 RepID=A0AAV4MM07_9ARAC|nr:hypothetical protein CDAR_190421 [Caerostris darwini]